MWGEVSGGEIYQINVFIFFSLGIVVGGCGGYSFPLR